jgi:branched-subunit amino acid transport protein
MSIFPLIVVMVIAVYGCRLAGFALRWQAPSVRRDQWLHFVPLSVFPALITLAILGKPEFAGVKSATLLIVGVIIWAARRFLARRSLVLARS